MPLANIAVAPTDATESLWHFSHYQDHLDIIAAIAKQKSTALTVYPIDRAGQFDSPQWQKAHQQVHDAMARVLATPQRADLTQRPLDDYWFWRNYQEHYAARQILGI